MKGFQNDKTITNGVIRRRKSKNWQYNDQKVKRMVYKTLHRKLKIKQDKHH